MQSEHFTKALLALLEETFDKVQVRRSDFG